MSNLKRYTLYILNTIDMLSIFLSHLLSYYLRIYLLSQFFEFSENANYTDFLMLTLLSYVIYNVTVLYSDENYVKRTVWEELFDCIKMVAFIIGCSLIYLYAVKRGELFSRIYVFSFAGLFLLIDVVLRTTVKKIIIPKFQSTGVVEDVLVITRKSDAASMIERLNDAADWRYKVCGCVITDKNMKGQKINDVDIISDRDHMFDDIHTSDIDSVLIDPSHENLETLNKWIRLFQKEGKIVHVDVPEFRIREESVRTLDRMGDTAIVTYRVISAMPKRQALFKRTCSFLFALVMMPAFLLATIFVAVFTNIESPGNILVDRVRVGKNNCRFYQYRYRVYRMDAEIRIRNNKSPYTIVGTFLKTTHLDGFPLLLNLLIGDMSLVGPKAPNLQRYLKMNSKQRNTLSVSPGVIGYWSCEGDPVREEKLEQKYIEDWNPAKDISIILRTIGHYLSGNSLRRDGDTHIQEELDFVAEVQRERQPYIYEKQDFPNHNKVGYIFYLFVKRLLDIVLSLAGIVILLPVYIVLTLLVMLDDGGNPFYSHARLGKDGERIHIYKFRSMRQDAGNLEKLLTPEQLEQYHREFKVDNDPRITKIGEFMRRTSLDELPQLLNILMGTLSIVGPRPIVEEETEHYGKDIAKFLSVKPGLTGYWQAYARNDAIYETGERQMMEMYYIDHQNLWTDIKIFFKTFGTVISGKGAQ